MVLHRVCIADRTFRLCLTESSYFIDLLLQIGLQRLAVQRRWRPEGAGKSTSSYGLVKAVEHRVKVGPTPRTALQRIGEHLLVLWICHDTQ